MTPNARSRRPRRGRFQTCPPLPSVRVRLRGESPAIPVGAGFKPARPYRRCASGCGAIARHPRRGRFQTCPPPPTGGRFQTCPRRVGCGAIARHPRRGRFQTCPPLPAVRVRLRRESPAIPAGAGFKPARPYRRCASGCGAARHSRQVSRARVPRHSVPPSLALVIPAPVPRHSGPPSLVIPAARRPPVPRHSGPRAGTH